MGHRQMIEEYGEAEAPLPLPTLHGIRQADALRTPWPETDCIIGNPPFLGDRHIRSSMGDEYVDWLKSEFKAGRRLAELNREITEDGRAYDPFG